MMASNTVRQMRSAFRTALRRRREVRQAFAQTLRRALREHRAALLASMKPAAAAAAAPPPAADLDTRVLTVIGRHPDGVRALDVGNELGVDWRRILEATRNLVAAGAVEQVDQHFYVVRKAGPQW
jgi:hypothetical protein